MPKQDATQSALAQLAAVRTWDNRASVERELRAALAAKSNFVVAKAAQIAGELAVAGVVPDLVSAFHRLMQNPAVRDKTCAATTAIAGALHHLDYREPDVYRAGIHHIQMEGSFGPPIDAAAQLRAECALGLARSLDPKAAYEIVDLLSDPWPFARVGAIRAIAARGDLAAELLLRLKAANNTGDTEMLAECFAGLLAAAPKESLEFVGRFAESEDDEVAGIALLALGESRIQGAFDVLKRCWKRRRTQKVMIAALTASRLDEAIDFLIEQVGDEPITLAAEIVRALAAFRSSDRVRDALEKAVQKRDDPRLTEAWRESWS